MRILLVEDDPSVFEPLQQYLTQNMFVVDHVTHLEAAKYAVGDSEFDVILLDRRLPDGEGMDLIKFCQRGGFPNRFIVLSAMHDVGDVVLGFEEGAIDYIAKPFQPSELRARIQNAMRFPREQSTARKAFGPLNIDLYEQQFYIGDQPLALTRAQFLVLECLMQRPGSVINKEFLLNRVYGFDHDGTQNSLEAHISRLRKVLAENGDELELAAMRGVGYILREKRR